MSMSVHTSGSSSEFSKSASSVSETRSKGNLNGREVSKIEETTIEIPNVAHSEPQPQLDLKNKEIKHLNQKSINKNESSEDSPETSIEMSSASNDVKTETSSSRYSSTSNSGSESESHSNSETVSDVSKPDEKSNSSEVQPENLEEGDLNGRKVKKKCDCSGDTCSRIAIGSFCGVLCVGIWTAAGVTLGANVCSRVSDCQVAGIVLIYIGLKFTIATVLTAGGVRGGLGGRGRGIGFGPGGIGFGR